MIKIISNRNTNWTMYTITVHHDDHVEKLEIKEEHCPFKFCEYKCNLFFVKGNIESLLVNQSTTNKAKITQISKWLEDIIAEYKQGDLCEINLLEPFFFLSDANYIPKVLSFVRENYSTEELEFVKSRNDGDCHSQYIGDLTEKANKIVEEAIDLGVNYVKLRKNKIVFNALLTKMLTEKGIGVIQLQHIEDKDPVYLGLLDNKLTTYKAVKL